MKKFENIVLASDMDGTFLAGNEEGMARNRKAVAYFKSQGGHFTFCTGREPEAVLSVVPDTAELVNLPVVTCNGACLYDFARGGEVERQGIPYEVVREFFQVLDATGAETDVSAVTEKGVLLRKITVPYMARSFCRMVQRGSRYAIRPVEQWGEVYIYRMAVVGEPEDITRLLPFLRERFQGKLELSRSYAHMIDIQTAGCTKATRLESVIRSEFDRPMYLVAVGDYGNDLEMLRLSDLACCPDNAAPEVKAVCRGQFCHSEKGVIGDIMEYLERIL